MSERQPEPSAMPSSSDTLQWASRGAVVSSRDLTGVTLGDFRIDRLLGRGGMGEVYLARQTSLNREVAFKVLRPDLLANDTYLARFESEAWAAAKLNDPNIVHIYSLGSIDGIRFIAMEYVQGTNLKEYLQRKSPELMLALSIMRQAGSAIKAAGEMGLVHRDIKPENLLLTKKGLVKVADFGLCRDQDSEKPHVTQPGVTMGTPLYMSPEQAQGHPLDHRSDLYSLGVTFYHMLAGRPPFHAETPLALALKHIKDTPVELAVHRPDLHPDLCRLVMKLMEKQPEHRYQSASEMLRDLARVREAIVTANAKAGAPVETTSPAITMDEMAIAAPSSAPSVATAPQPRRAKLFASMIAGGLILGGLVGWSLRPPDLLSERQGTVPPPPALWIAPNWQLIPRQPSAEAQYRFAQIQADLGTRRAAWLAVPGHFPQSKEWAPRSYTQLGRLLFRDHDSMHLKPFTDELERMDRPHEKRLAEILRAGLGVLEDDPEGVLNLFTPNFVGSLTDPAFAELALEVTLEAERAARRSAVAATNTNLSKLRQIQFRLIQRTVDIMFQDTLGRLPQI
jgi:tRNA A-37 threonylcarbamoyl transferase component Bud32